jgi:AraC-like DNA-binding protein
MDDQLITTRYLPLLLRHVQAHGGAPEALRERFALPDEEPATDGGEVGTMEVPLRLLDDVAAAAAQMLGDRTLGLSVAKSCTRGSYGLVEQLCRAAPTLSDAAQMFSSYERLLCDRSEYKVETTPFGLRIRHSVPRSANGLGAHANENVLAALLTLFRDFVGRSITPDSVGLAHDTLTDPIALEAFFGTSRIYPSVHTNVIVFSARDAALPILSANEQLTPVLNAYAQTLLGGGRNAGNLLDRVRASAHAELGQGAPLAVVARRLQISPRHLQRQLADEGITYHSIREDIRREIATRVLHEGSLSISELARQLGYSDARVFYRSFRRWTGMTPQQWLRGQQAA